MKAKARTYAQASRLLVGLCLAAISMTMAHAAAKQSLAIKSAAYNKKTASLVVKTTGNTSGGLLSLIHSQGGVLGQSSDSEHIFTIPQADLGEIPCQVEARIGELKVSKAVAGASAECKKVPICKLLTPASNISVNANTPTRFEAQVTLKDKKAAPLTIEWDFAGGAMGHPFEKLLKDGKPITNGKVTTEASFVRDNSRYHVRFAAIDKLGRRCEAGSYVTVGTPPTEQPDSTPLALDAQRSQPSRGSGLSGEIVVMPFEKRSMQSGHDAKLLPYAPLVYPLPANTINAYVYQKGLQPVALGTDDVELAYTAASNPADPVGPNSINSTSQNWPLDSAWDDASLQKGELFKRYQRPQGPELPEGYGSYSLIDYMTTYSGQEGYHLPLQDEGAYGLYLTLPINADHGRYMPGINGPYTANDAQAFSEFVFTDNWFSAYWLPVTDIDDRGRVNPTSLFRIQATAAGTQTPLTATDTVVTATKDFHCRECHTRGGLGAKPDVTRVNRDNETSVMLHDADSNSVADQELAALFNMNMLHDFYDHLSMGGMSPNRDGADECAHMCHNAIPFAQVDAGFIGQETSRAGEGNLSNAIHRLHGKLQYNDDKTDILRDGKGRYLCSIPGEDCPIDAGRSVFPVKDANGNILPMEQNCLKCHSGQREQSYRDRMFTAGVTCYQCHGDMLAVSQVYEKSRPNPDGNSHRLQWLDQPDCGSCHTGSGNQGNDGKNGFFSAGVKNLAFDENDPSATPNAVDLSNPDQRRFAVLPLTSLPQATAGYNETLKTPLYRMGKDIHGEVACAACHGAAHSIWPNRDPNANDNVTSLELQGHTGSVLECNVCHMPDSFAELKDNDEGLKVADAKVGVLGGPHNLHPINDPYWWKSAAKDPGNSDGSHSGGWHNDYAKLPGKSGEHEDQCAACHGNDHKGTRLSKAPVDRVFDFSDAVDLKQLKKLGIKPKITVKAGTPIGCNTCHSVTLSCKDSPNPNCGQASEQVTASTNLAPTVTPPYVINATIGEDLSYTLSATDPDGDTPVFALAGDSNNMTLDAGGVLNVPYDQFSNWIQSIETSAEATSHQYVTSPFDHDFNVVVSDSSGSGAYRLQPLSIHFDCPSGLTWDVYSSSCMPLAILSLPIGGHLDAGPIQHHQVVAISATQLSLSYALVDPVPDGMSIDDKGYISWDSSKVAGTGEIYATIRVSDTAGNAADLPFDYTVCRTPMHWSDSDGCVGSVHITSIAPNYINADSFTYQVTATDDNHQPIQYSLVNAPDGMSISSDGLISWGPSSFALGRYYQVNFQVKASTSPDNWVIQAMQPTVCSGDAPIADSVGGCSSGSLHITSIPDAGASAHQAYRYQLNTDPAIDTGSKLILNAAPPGMSIDANGLINWNTSGYEGQFIEFGIVASDGNGGWVQQYVGMSVCSADTPIYDPLQASCVPGPIQFTSTLNFGASANQVFNNQIGTANDNHLSVNYALEGAPAGMSIDGNGLFSWDSAGFDGQHLEFRIVGSDTAGAWTQQTVNLDVCGLDTPKWNAEQGVCEP